MNSTIVAKIFGPVNNIKMNMTTTESENTVDILYTQTPGDWRFMGVFFGFLVTVLGAGGNGLTVWAYARNKNLQTSFNILIANLCLVELVFSVVVIPLTLPGFITEKLVYPEGFCSFVGYLYYSSLACSLHNLVAIAINRYIGIVKSEVYQRLFSGRRLAICIASIWITAPVLYLPIIIGGAISWDPSSLRCSIGTAVVSDAVKWYNMALNIVFQAVPLIILIVVYTAIFKKVKEVQRKLKHHGRASFRKTSSKTFKASISISKTPKSGNTSEDTGDEFKPSSLIEGVGQGFKPIIGDKSSNTGHSESSHAVHDEKSSPTTSPLSPVELDYSTCPTASEDEESGRESPVPKPSTKKRNSLWTILMRNSQKIPAVDSMAERDMTGTISNSSDHNLSEDEGDTTSKLHTENEKEENQVELRENRLQIKDIRRKKSLSAPTLPNLDFLSVAPVNVSISNASSPGKPKLQVSNLSENDMSDSENRMARTRSAYYQRNGDAHKSVSYNDVSPLKTNTSWSLRLHPKKKESASSLNHKYDSDDEVVPRSRVGTIARKIHDRKTKANRKERKRRQRHRMLRKKHARERQLVYSSLTICIAFALCILPTAMLYLVLVLFGITVPASVGMVVACISWLHAVVNPIIYGYLNSQYRREYTRIVHCLTQKIFKKEKDQNCNHKR